MDADSYFQKAISAAVSLKSSSTFALLADYASFLYECGKYEPSEDYFLQSLSLNPINSKVYSSYANLLKVIGENETAKLVLQRSEMITALLNNK